MKTFIERMDEEKAQAEIDYIRIMLESKDKDYMDLLPNEFRTFKRSLIKREILDKIDTTLEMLNKTTIYEGRKFDKKDIVLYLLHQSMNSSFHLTHLFIPRVPDFWMDFAVAYRAKYGKGADFDTFETDNIALLEEKRKIEHSLSSLTQTWDQYQDYLNARNGTLEIDYEEDGFPRLGRGNICYAFIPVEGYFPKDHRFLKLYNPRTKVTHAVKVEAYNKEYNLYKVFLKGEIVWLIERQEMEDAFDALCSTNKEIYKGWWNKTLILKEL